ERVAQNPSPLRGGWPSASEVGWGPEPVPVVNRREPRATRSVPMRRGSGVRGRCLLTHGGGREAGSGGHFLAPLDDLVCMVAVPVVSLVDGAASASVASGLRIDGPLSASR